MKVLKAAVKALQRERKQVAGQLGSIDAALTALGSLNVNGSRRGRHTMSAAARRKISLAQKARWAKQNARPKRTISAGGRRRIAAAQRARWAKVKKNKAV